MSYSRDRVRGSNVWREDQSPLIDSEMVPHLDQGDAMQAAPSPTPGAAALDASINMDGTVRLALEQDGQGLSITLTMGEFIAFVTGGIRMWVQYYESGLMGRVQAGKSPRIIT